MKQNSSKVIFLLFIIINICIYSYINIDTSSARYELFMDEQITYDGVLKVYNSSSPKELIDNLREGDQRYGKLLWNSYALLSYPFYKVFGPQGLIVSNRLLGSFIQLTSFILLTIFFIKSFWLRSACLFVLSILPSTLYYAHMPKPEPLMLLFLTLFLILKFNTNKIKLSYFTLGVAFGMKVSLFPFLLFDFLLNFIKDKFNLIKTIKSKYLYAYLGLLFAVPLLTKIHSKAYKKYIKSTFMNSSHGQDSIDVSLLTWLDYIFSNLLPLFFAILLFGIVLTYVYKELKRDKLTIFLFDNKSLYLFTIACSFLLPTILFVKRHWGFYLHIPLILFTILAFRYLDKVRLKNLKATKFFAISLCILSIPLTIEFSKSATKLGTRSQQEIHIDKTELWKTVQSYIDNLTPKSKKICIDPRMYYDKTYNSYKFIPFWGAYDFTKTKCDFIAMYDLHFTKDFSKNPKLSKRYEKMKTQYSKYVKDDLTFNGKCTSNCYKRIHNQDHQDVIFLFKE